MIIRKKILLAEQEPFLSGIYQNKLKLEGFEVTAAMDGEQVLQKLNESDHDLLLLNIIMPKLNGFAVLKALRADAAPLKARLPVIIFSSLGEQRHLQQALQYGADDYIVKENSTPQEVIYRIQRLIN